MDENADAANANNDPYHIATIRRCRYCGDEIPERAKVCRSCGRSQNWLVNFVRIDVVIFAALATAFAALATVWVALLQFDEARRERVEASSALEQATNANQRAGKALVAADELLLDVQELRDDAERVRGDISGAKEELGNLGVLTRTAQAEVQRLRRIADFTVLAEAARAGSARSYRDLQMLSREKTELAPLALRVAVAIREDLQYYEVIPARGSG